MSTHRNAWDRLPDEREKFYEAFLRYLSMDQPRSVKKLAALLGRAHTTLDNYSKRFRWNERAVAYDEAVRKRFEKGQLEEAERLGKEHMQAARLLRDLGLAELNRRARRVRRKTEASDGDDLEPVIRDRDALKLAVEGIKLERLVSGQATERIGHEESWDLSRLTDEEVALLRALREKATS